MQIVIPLLRLSNDVAIPAIGLGTYPMRGEVLSNAVAEAFKAGYRLIDSSDNYFNEEDLGLALQQLYKTHGKVRNELFLVSKVSDDIYPLDSLIPGANTGHYFWKNSPFMKRPDAVVKIVNEKLDKTLKCLNTDYLDLYLIHWPYPDYLLEIWNVLETLYKSGKVRAIGVCNCRKRHLEKLNDNCCILPMVNQIETSPINIRTDDIEFCNNHNIKIMVYSPLMSLRRTEFTGYQTALHSIALRHGRSESQILLRYDIQRGLIPIPKSSKRDRLRSNIDIFDFQLSSDDMRILSDCNLNFQYLPESKACPGN